MWDSIFYLNMTSAKCHYLPVTRHYILPLTP